MPRRCPFASFILQDPKKKTLWVSADQRETSQRGIAVAQWWLSVEGVYTIRALTQEFHEISLTRFSTVQRLSYHVGQREAGFNQTQETAAVWRRRLSFLISVSFKTEDVLHFSDIGVV